MRRRERNCRQNAIKFLLIAYSVLLVLAYHSLAFTSTSPYSYSSSSSSSTILEISQPKQISRRWHLSLEASRQNSNAPDGQGGQGGQGGKKKPTNENQNDESQGTGSTDSGSGSGSTGSFGRISEKTIEDIKTYADIVTVIESHNLPLFSRSGDGNRATCVCPFHNDRNPSMNIDNEKGIYKCFSCGAGGDVFNFVREFDYVSNSQKGKKMSYPASIHKVAKEFCGEDILRQMPTNGSGGDGNGNGSIHSNKPLTPEKKAKLEEKRKQRERILLANSVAADYYAKMLITSPSAGIARSHLHQRGATPTMVRTFGIGFASDAYYNNNNNASGKGKGNVKAWGEGSLVEHLKEWEFTTQEILDAGLATVTSSAKKRLNMAGSFASSSSGKVDETTKSKPAKGTEASNGGRKEEKLASDFFGMDVGLALTDWFRLVGTSTKLGFLRRTNTNDAVP